MLPKQPFHTDEWLSAQHLVRLAYAGRLVLLLYGWNELAAEARLRAIRELDMLRREYLLLCVIAGTRTDAELVNTMLDAAIETVVDTEDRPLFTPIVVPTIAG